MRGRYQGDTARPDQLPCRRYAAQLEATADYCGLNAWAGLVPQLWGSNLAAYRSLRLCYQRVIECVILISMETLFALHIFSSPPNAANGRSIPRLTSYLHRPRSAISPPR